MREGRYLNTLALKSGTGYKSFLDSFSLYCLRDERGKILVHTRIKKWDKMQERFRVNLILLVQKMREVRYLSTLALKSGTIY